MRRNGTLAAVVLCVLASSAAADDPAGGGAPGGAPAAPPPPANPPAPDAASLAVSAATKLAAGDAKGAAADLTRAIALAPDDAELRHRRAECRAELGDVAGTVEDARKATAIDPGKFPLDVALWRTAVETSRKASGSTEPDLALIQAEIEAIRGKRFKSAVPSAPQSAKDFGAMVESSIDKEMPKARRGDIEAGLSRLGLLPPTFDFKEAVADALMSQAAAYYDPKQKKFFNLAGDMPPEMLEATAAHELVHALQDQYHDLDAWFAAHDDDKQIGARDDDRTLALRSLVEGEATFVQTVWQVEHMLHQPPEQAATMARMSLPLVAGMELEALIKFAKSQASMVPPGSAVAKAMDEMDKIEPYVLVPLMAAYMNGANAVAAVQAKGWDRVDAMYDDPPLTSEQCLHPEKFVTKRDRPTPVAVPHVPEVAAAGWRDADAAIHGELYFRVLLRRNGVTAPAARKAAAGWDGDRYRAWRTEDGRTAFVLATTWDTEKDAQEFFDAYRSTLAAKYPKRAEDAGDDANAVTYACGDETLGTGALVLHGREVFAVEGFDAEIRAKVVATLTAMQVEHVE